MTENEKLRYEYFIETGIVWMDTNDSIEIDYLKWLEAKIIYTRCCETLPCSYAEGYNDAISKIKEEAKYIDKQ